MNTSHPKSLNTTHRIILSGLFVVLSLSSALAKSNEIYSFKVLGQTQDAVRFEVRYFYSGDHGTDGIRLGAITLLNGQSTGVWGYVPGIVSPGNHSTQIRLSLIPTAPRRHKTNGVQFDLYEPNGAPFYSKTFPFTKEWINNNPKAGKALKLPTSPSPPVTQSTTTFAIQQQKTPVISGLPLSKSGTPMSKSMAPLAFALAGSLPLILSVVLIAFVLAVLFMAVPFLRGAPPYTLGSVAPAQLLPAGFWRRVVASLVDSLVFFILQLTFAIVAFIVIWKLRHLGWISRLPRANGGFGILLWWLYFAGFESSAAQATPGKHIVGIAVTDKLGRRLSFARASGRTFAKYISMLTLLIGYLMAAFTEKKQALHDKIAGCYVVRKGKSVLGRTVAITGIVLLLLIIGGGLGVRYWLIPMAMRGFQRQISATMQARPASGPLPEKIDTYPDIPARASEGDYNAAFAMPIPPNSDGTSTGIPVGPVLLKKDHFWAGERPNFWVKIQAPNFPNREKACRIVIRHVWNSSHQDVYDAGNTFEKETFQIVNLMTGPVPYLSGIRSVYVREGTQEQDVKSIEGEVIFRLPIDVESVEWDKSEGGKEQSVGSVKIRLQSIKDSTVSVQYEGSPDLRLKVMAFNASVQPLSSSSSFWTTVGNSQNISFDFQGIVQRCKIYVASKLIERRYPFALNF